MPPPMLLWLNLHKFLNNDKHQIKVSEAFDIKNELIVYDVGLKGLAFAFSGFLPSGPFFALGISSSKGAG